MLKIFFLISLIHFSIFAMDQKWDVKKYEANSSFQQEFAEELINKMDFKNIKSILDIGCGSGINAEKMAQKAPNSVVVGIDLSEDMINKAKEANYLNGHNRLRFSCMDAQKMDFYGEKCDFATSFFCLHFIKDQQEVFNRISTTLNDNGKVLLTMSAKIDKSDCRLKVLETLKTSEAWKDVFNGRDLASQHYDLSAQELKEKFTKANLKFDNDKIQEIIIQRKFESSKALEDYILGWIGGFGIIAPLSPEKRAEFVHDWVEGYKEQISCKDGSVQYDIPILVAEAYK